MLSHFPSQHASWRSRSLSRGNLSFSAGLLSSTLLFCSTKALSILSALQELFSLPLLVVYKVKPELSGWSFEKCAIKIVCPEVQRNQPRAVFYLLTVKRKDLCQNYEFQPAQCIPALDKQLFRGFCVLSHLYCHSRTNVFLLNQEVFSSEIRNLISRVQQLHFLRASQHRDELQTAC